MDASYEFSWYCWRYCNLHLKLSVLLEILSTHGLKNTQCVETYHLSIAITGLRILFLPESTEGVAVGATTAMDYENSADSTEK